jgi:hypothetical protein
MKEIKTSNDYPDRRTKLGLTCLNLYNSPGKILYKGAIINKSTVQIAPKSFSLKNGLLR